MNNATGQAQVTLTPEQELAALRAENERLRANAQASANRKLTLKVSDKGGVSVYGLGRFPVTLYRGQWEKLLAGVDEIKAFIEVNASSLATKD